LGHGARWSVRSDNKEVPVCIQAIVSLRSLGLTIKEIQQLAAVYLDRPGDPIGRRLAELLDRAEQRIEQRREELDVIQRRIHDFRAANGAALAGRAELADGDLRRRRAA
jgi:MerR family transcriptional regulator, copper efflux regulator